MLRQRSADLRTVDALLAAHPAPWLLRVEGGERGRVYAVEDAQGQPVVTLADVGGQAAQLLGELGAALPELLAAHDAAAPVLAVLCPVELAGATLVERHPAPTRLSLARRVCLAHRLTAAAGRRVRAVLRELAPAEDTAKEGRRTRVA